MELYTFTGENATGVLRVKSDAYIALQPGFQRAIERMPDCDIKHTFVVEEKLKEEQIGGYFYGWYFVRNYKKDVTQSASTISTLVSERTEEEMKIELLVRKKYSISQELMLHRKKLAGTATDEEWNEYYNYIEQCIAEARQAEPTA